MQSAYYTTPGKNMLSQVEPSRSKNDLLVYWTLTVLAPKTSLLETLKN